MSTGLRADAVLVATTLVCATKVGAPSGLIWALLAASFVWSWWTRKATMSLVVFFAALLCGAYGAFFFGQLPITLAKVSFLNVFVHCLANGTLRRFDRRIALGFAVFWITMWVSGWGATWTWDRWEPLVSLFGLAVLVQTLGSNLSRTQLQSFLLHCGAVLVFVLIAYVPDGLSGALANSPASGWTVRAGGPLASPNLWAMTLVAWLPILVHFQFGQSAREHHWVAIALLCLAPLSILQTMSRSATLVLGLVLLTLCFLHRAHWRSLCVAAGFFLAMSAVFLNWEDVSTRMVTLANRDWEIQLGHWSLNSRATVAQYALEAFYETPWVGVGVGNSLPVIEQMSENRFHIRPHNTYLTVLVEQGLVGFAGLGFLCATFIRSGLKGPTSILKPSWLKTWLPTVCVILGFGLSADLLTFAPFWVPIALALAATRAVEERDGSPRSQPAPATLGGPDSTAETAS